MFKAKEVSMNSLVVYVMAGLLLSSALYVARPHTGARTETLTFTAVETVVVKPAVNTLVKSAPVVETIATQAPIPSPTVMAPLPIVAPVVMSKVMPIYPPSARAKGETGLVNLSILVGLSGLPQDVKVNSSSGNAQMDESAVRAVSQWKFLPALQGSQALASWYDVPVSFVIN
ncbi:MAG: energy transducer TonB [Candidatus Margulisiibacteriota bacterium]